jgi:hypothetical protein
MPFDSPDDDVGCLIWCAIVIAVAVALLLTLTLSSCATPATPHWRDRPPDGPDTPQKVDPIHGPNFGV